MPLKSNISPTKQENVIESARRRVINKQLMENEKQLRNRYHGHSTINKYMFVIQPKPSKRNIQVMRKSKVKINESSMHGGTSRSKYYRRHQ